MMLNKFFGNRVKNAYQKSEKTGYFYKHYDAYKKNECISNLVHDNHIHNDSEYYFSKMNHSYINGKLRFLCEAKYTMSQI